MSEQVMVSRELLERMRDLIYVLAHHEDSIGQDACSVGGHFPELLAQPVSAQPDDDDECMPEGIFEGIMRSGTVDAVSMAAQSLRAQPAGEVPEVVGYIGQGLTPVDADEYAKLSRPGESSLYDTPLMTIAQHTRIVAALQARAVVMPERKHTDWRAAAGHETPNHGWNACLDEVARLNAAPVQQVSVPDGFERYRLANKFCEQRLVTDDHVRAIVVDAFASGYGFGIAAAPAAPAADAGLVEALKQAFPLFDEDGLNELYHHCEIAVLGDRKRLHKLLAAHRAKGVV